MAERARKARQESLPISQIRLSVSLAIMKGHAAQHVLKGRVRAQVIKSNIGLQEYQPRLGRTVNSVQTTKGSSFLSNAE